MAGVLYPTVLDVDLFDSHKRDKFTQLAQLSEGREIRGTLVPSLGLIEPLQAGELGEMSDIFTCRPCAKDNLSNLSVGPHCGHVGIRQGHAAPH